MVKVDDFSAEFLINGVAVQEYPDGEFDQEPIEDEASKYVEAAPGATFSILCIVDESYELAPAISWLSFQLSVDGYRVRGFPLTKEWLRAGKRKVRLNKAVVQGADKVTLYPLTFAELKIDEEFRPKSETDRQKKQYSALGEVVVEVWRIVGNKSTLKKNFSPGQHPTQLEVHAKAVEDRAVSLAFNINEACGEEGTHTRWDGSQADNEPLATFKFKYRTNAALQKLGIIERSPSPAPIPAVEDLDPGTLTQEQMTDSFLELQAQVKENKVKVKQEQREETLRALREHEHSSDNSSGTVEEVESPRKKRRIEVVNMLEDD